MGAVQNSTAGGNTLATYTNAIGQVSNNYAARSTAAEQKYQSALGSYQSAMQSLELSKIQWEKQAERLNLNQRMQNILMTIQQTQVMEEEALAVDDIYMASRAAQAQVIAQAAANGVEGNSTRLAVREVVGQAAEAVSDVRFRAVSEVNTIQLDKMIARESARVTDFYYYEPVAPVRSDYTQGIMGNTLQDLSNTFNRIMPTKISAEDKSRYGL